MMKNKLFLVAAIVGCATAPSMKAMDTADADTNAASKEGEETKPMLPYDLTWNRGFTGAMSSWTALGKATAEKQAAKEHYQQRPFGIYINTEDGATVEDAAHRWGQAMAGQTTPRGATSMMETIKIAQERNTIPFKPEDFDPAQAMLRESMKKLSLSEKEVFAAHTAAIQAANDAHEAQIAQLQAAIEAKKSAHAARIEEQMKAQQARQEAQRAQMTKLAEAQVAAYRIAHPDTQATKQFAKVTASPEAWAAFLAKPDVKATPSDETDK